MRIFILIFLAHTTVIAYSQNPSDTRMLQKMDEAVDLMNLGKYDEANDGFVYVLQNVTTVPSDLAYYFGRNSYHLSKFKQSINWLNKYIQLKGTQGRFYEEATKYLQLSEEQYLQYASNNKQQIQSDLASGEYDCGGLSKMICPACRGEGVIFKQGPFDVLYQTCPYSEGEAYLSCEDYNLYMKGMLEPKVKN